MTGQAYNFAYLDEQTKRMIRRAILKALAVPGYQVPFASREPVVPVPWLCSACTPASTQLGSKVRPR